MQLYETHIPVADTKVAENFYRNIVGLPFAYRAPTRDIVFLWTDTKNRGMLGLWGPATGFGRVNGAAPLCHFAFEVSIEQLFERIKTLNARGIQTTAFGGAKSMEPSVIGWMPSAQIYFRDPDGHSLEFITLLADPPNPDFIGPYSEWTALPGCSGRGEGKP